MEWSLLLVDTEGVRGSSHTTHRFRLREVVPIEKPPLVLRLRKSSSPAILDMLLSATGVRASEGGAGVVAVLPVNIPRITFENAHMLTWELSEIVTVLF